LQRISAAIASLGDAARRHDFFDQPVLLTGDTEVLASQNGQWSFLGALRLLVRMCGRIDVSLPPAIGNLDQQMLDLAEHVGEPGQVRLRPAEGVPYEAVLSVGTGARADSRWTVINSNGWLARASSGTKSLPRDVNQSNPIAAFAASCLGVAEVFKRLIALRPDRGGLVDGLTFSLEDYRTDHNDLGHQLPDRIPLDVLIVGAGAIGNGIGLLISQLSCTGRATVVDPQTFQPPNLGTCALIGRKELGTPKAKFLAEVIGARLTTRWRQARLAELRDEFGSTLPYHATALAALDSIPARHETQDLWPDLLVDGAIGDFIAQVGRHPWGPDIGCVRCVFQEQPGPSSEQMQSLATGLSLDRLRFPDSLVSRDDVADAPERHRAWLGERIGKSVCSVVQEGVLHAISTKPKEAGTTRTVPFVPGLSACMVVGELIKHACGWSSRLEPRIQFDCLRGPAHGLEFPQSRRKKCTCVERTTNIERWRYARAARAAAN
jgi:molybdopterin/thiamine biosynthesis adenylyltransferase